jgi:hypothetical protein
MLRTAMGVIPSWLDDPRPDGGEDHRGQYPVLLEIAEIMFLAISAIMRAVATVARPGGRSTAGRPGWA